MAAEHWLTIWQDDEGRTRTECREAGETTADAIASVRGRPRSDNPATTGWRYVATVATDGTIIMDVAKLADETMRLGIAAGLWTGFEGDLDRENDAEGEAGDGG